MDREALIETLREESERRRRGTRQLRISAGLLLAITLLCATWTVARGKPFDWTSQIPLFVLLTSGLAMGMTPRHKLAARTAARLEDKRVAGDLVETLDAPDSGLLEIVEDALVHLLPRLGAEDAGLLTSSQLKILTAALGRTKNATFRRAGVDALRHLGDSTVLATMDAWIAAAPDGDDKAQNLARMAAADLRMRLARTKIEAAVATPESTLPLPRESVRQG